MQTSKHWQLDLEAAKRYQEIPVPTILGPAAHALVDKVKEVADNLAMYQTEAGATVPFRIQVAKAQK